MTRSPAETGRPAAPRLNPVKLRRLPPYFGSEYVKLASIETYTVAVRKSFLECDAEYNPLGKFGASWSRL